MYRDKVAGRGDKFLLIETRPRVHCADVNGVNAYHEMMSNLEVRVQSSHMHAHAKEGINQQRGRLQASACYLQRG